MPSAMEILTSYLKTMEAFPSRQQVADFLSPEVVHEEFPNRLFAAGRQSDLQALLDASQRAPELLANQRYHLRRAVVSGDEIAAELEWTGVLRRGLGNLPEGASLRAAVAQFLSLENGKIRSIRSYDCYYPFER